MLDKQFCTYLTIYSGNKLPPFYIGSSSVSNIKKGYRGSVSSYDYKSIWKSEIKHNNHLFKTLIISYHNTRKEATKKEVKLQLQLDVVRNPLYINRCIIDGDSKHFYYPSKELRKRMSDKRKGKNNPNYGKKHTFSLDQRKRMSDSKKGKIRSNEHRKNLSLSMIGHHVDDKTKQKIGDSNSRVLWKIFLLDKHQEDIYNLRKWCRNKFGNHHESAHTNLNMSGYYKGYFVMKHTEYSEEKLQNLILSKNIHFKWLITDHNTNTEFEISNLTLWIKNTFDNPNSASAALVSGKKHKGYSAKNEYSYFYQVKHLL